MMSANDDESSILQGLKVSIIFTLVEDVSC